MKRAIAALAALTALLVAGCGLSGHTRPHQQVGEHAAALRAAFNADAGKTRLLAVVSPTCGTCLNGATVIQKDVLAATPGTRLRAYIVWVPKKGGHENDVAEATRTVSDLRATHYWDGPGHLLHAYQPVLGISEDVWDVYLIYRPGVRWDGPTPPKPDYWMQQLDIDTAPRLDGATFERHVRRALGS